MSKTRTSLTERLLTRYQMVIRNESNLEEKTPVSFTLAKALGLFMLFSALIFSVSFLLSKTILAFQFDPKYAQQHITNEFVYLTHQLDSLEKATEQKDKFIAHLKSVMLGQYPEDKSSATPTPAKSEKKKETNTDTDSTFIKEMESAGEKYSFHQDNVLLNFNFFPPVQGVVSSPFNRASQHPGIDVVAKTNEPVKCIADGTVMLASWTQDAGYVIAIQHTSHLVSVYKHNAELLKRVGDSVNAGDIISIIGNTGEQTQGQHLHFELWYKGNPLNPLDFISF